LSLVVAQLATSVDRLSNAFGRSEKVAATLRRIVIAIIVMMVLGIGVAGYAVYIGVRAGEASRAEIQTRREVLCPLYELFLDSYKPDAQPSERRKQYEESFVILRRSYEVLDCE